MQLTTVLNIIVNGKNETRDWFDLVSLLLPVFISLLALIIAFQSYKHTTFEAEKNSIITKSNETQKIFDLWFSIDFFHLRTKCKIIILILKRLKVDNNDVKLTDDNIETILCKDQYEQAMEMIYFFDKVGWLAAGQLVNRAYILGPMHHSIQGFYEGLHPIIVYLRKKSKQPHSTGFKWLYHHLRTNPQKYILLEKFEMNDDFVVHPHNIELKDDKIDLNADYNMSSIPPFSSSLLLPELVLNTTSNYRRNISGYWQPVITTGYV